MLARYPARRVWSDVVAPYLDAHVGREFERIVMQAWDRQAAAGALPMVATWGRWEGVDRSRRSLEIDLVAELADGRMLTGAVKWQRRPVGARVLSDHVAMLERAADAGRAWAHRALEPGALFLGVAAAGFTKAFLAAVEEEPRTAHCWTLEDLYGGVD
jgi:uncharacterized protein